ncbi:MAG: acetylglutamate kinase [Alphaproteobacteria bacterium]|jgi:acetylglutamate kinase
MTDTPENSDITLSFSAREWLRTAKTLTEALPYLQRYDKKQIVIKYGGHAMGDAKRSAEFAQDVVLLKQCGIDPVVVHGGGPQIAEMLKRLDIPSQFINGLRVTDEATMKIVQMVLAGSINKDIVSAIGAQGGYAVGLCGKDAQLITVKPLKVYVTDPETKQEKLIDLGFVGEPETVNTTLLDTFNGSDIVPIIAPVGADAQGRPYNINADTAAGAIAGGLKAKRLLLLTDVAGVKDAEGQLIEKLTVSEAQALIASGVASGGMIPKLETCIKAVQEGVSGVVILDGRVPHAVLLELFTNHGAGTLVIPDC